MEIQRALIDRQFDRYVLSADGVQKKEVQLPVAVLEPLDAVKTTRKAQWEARIHSNGLTADPLRSGALHGSVAYYIDANFRVMQVVGTKAGLKTLPIYELPPLQQRNENVSLQVAGMGLLVLNDGNGTIRLLKSTNPAVEAALWKPHFEFQPLAGKSTLLLKATYDDALQKFVVVLAEPIVSAETDATFRLWVADVSHAPSSVDSMDVDSGAVVGLRHKLVEVAVTSTLPDYISFKGHELILLVEGTCNLVLESLVAPPSPAATGSTVAAAQDGGAHAVKRHHDESDLEMDVDEVLAKVPRAGIGYHGDVSDTNHHHQQEQDLDLAKPLQERFRKSSIPYSSLDDEPLHSTSIDAVRSPTSQAGAREGTLEVPTPDTILGGFEECDDVDPNAKAVLLLINTTSMVVQDKIDINCHTFRYLGKSTSTTATTTSAAAVDTSLLFQNDVHGLIFSVEIVASRLTLSHTGTFPAFGFVQASKQDKKYLTFTADAGFACVGEFEKRLFVYHGAPAGHEKDAHVLKQNVVEIGDHQLMGMCAIGSSILLLSPHHAYQVDVESSSC